VELMSQGADISMFSSSGNNCLHYAALNERKGIIDLLLRSGADSSVPNEAGLLPIEMTKHANVRELFLRDRSSIFSPIAQTRMLLSDYIQQQAEQEPSINKNLFANEESVLNKASSGSSSNGSSALSATTTTGIRASVFNMADELVQVANTSEKSSNALPPATADMGGDNGTQSRAGPSPMPPTSGRIHYASSSSDRLASLGLHDAAPTDASAHSSNSNSSPQHRKRTGSKEQDKLTLSIASSPVKHSSRSMLNELDR
jgi:hypothetical protein